MSDEVWKYFSRLNQRKQRQQKLTEIELTNKTREIIVLVDGGNHSLREKFCIFNEECIPLFCPTA
jgi:hypothetical protein